MIAPGPRIAMRSLLVLVSASIMFALLPLVASSAATPHLVGRVDAAHQSSVTHVIAVAGWVEDTTRPSVSVHVCLLVDGRRVLVTLANVSRPDVNAARHISGRHGFHVVFHWKAGARSVLVQPYNAPANVASRRVHADASSPGTRIVTEARKFVGRTPYVSGGASPATGFDCSGYTQYVYRHAHVASLPRSAEQQRHAVRIIPGSRARAGDLVFYLSGGSAYHVAIYAGHAMQYAAATEQDGLVHQGVWSSDVQYGTDWHR